MTERESLFSALRGELPRCGRHKDASHIDCVECMYLSCKVYAPLEQIEARIQELEGALCVIEGMADRIVETRRIRDEIKAEVVRVLGVAPQ